MTNPWIGIALVIALVLVSMAALTLGAARFGASREPLRKLLHVEMGAVTLGFPWLFAGAWPVIALACTSVAWFGLLRACGPIEARFGKPLAARRHRSLGEIWFACGVCLSFLLASDVVAYCIAILVLTLADTAAALVGRRFGRLLRMPLAARKSAAGSAAFFAVAFTVAFLALYAAADVPLVRAIGSAALVAVLTTAIEAVLGRGLDNLFIPLGALAALRAVS